MLHLLPIVVRAPLGGDEGVRVTVVLADIALDQLVAPQHVGVGQRAHLPRADPGGGDRRSKVEVEVEEVEVEVEVERWRWR